MNATLITTHVADAADRLLQQYQGRPNVTAFLAAFTQHVQQLENALFGVPASFQLYEDVAVGAQLDVIGALVGVARNGLTDTQYRALIRGTIAQNNGDATTETLLDIIRGLFQTSAVFLKQPNSVPHAPQVAQATVSISVGDPTVPNDVLALVQSSLKAALGAGVAINYLGRFQAQAGAFAFQGKQPWVRGFGSVHNPDAGGRLGSLLTNMTSS